MFSLSRLTAGLLALTMFFALFGTAHAQIGLSTTVGAAAEEEIDTQALTSPEAVDALVSRLSDEEVRSLLLDQLNATAAASGADAGGADFREFFYHATVGAFSSTLEGLLVLPRAVQGQIGSIQIFTQNQGGDGWLWLWGSVLGATVIGLLLEWPTNRLVLRALPKLEYTEQPSLRESVTFLGRRIVREVLGVFVFFVFATIALNQILDGSLLPLASAILFYLIMIPRLTFYAARFLLAPSMPDFRLVHTDDGTARFLTIHLVGLAITVGLVSVLMRFNAFNGLAIGELRIGFWLDLIFRIYFVWIIWRSWDGLVQMMRGVDAEAVTPFEDWVARAYPAFGITVVLAMVWVISMLISYDAPQLLAGRPDVTTLALLLMAPAFDTLIRSLVHHLTPPMKGEGPVAEKAFEATKASYKRIGRILVFGLVLVLIARTWGLDREVLASETAVGTVVGAFFDVSFIIAFGYLAYEVATLVINRKLADEMTAQGLTAEAASAGEIGGTGGTRLSTVLPLLLVVLQTTIVVVFGLIALSELGIDTTPLLAGAGILGLAIGFGAQKLVTDVVSGAFFLIDDAFRMGEYVEMGDTKGTVEKISIRSMQLRHHRGPVFTVPYGEIQFLKNYSRDWGIMKLPFLFPFDTDPERVRKIFKKIGQELLEHPDLGDYFIEPFKSQGVVGIDEVGMLIRGKFTAKPGKQFEMRKAIYNKVHAALDAAGIPFARREVRVALPDGVKVDELTEDQKQSIAAAATEAAQAANAGTEVPSGDTR